MAGFVSVRVEVQHNFGSGADERSQQSSRLCPQLLAAVLRRIPACTNLPSNQPPDLYLTEYWLQHTRVFVTRFLHLLRISSVQRSCLASLFGMCQIPLCFPVNCRWTFDIFLTVRQEFDSGADDVC